MTVSTSQWWVSQSAPTPPRDEKRLPRREQSAGKLAASVKAMGRRLLTARRTTFYPLDEARLPPARRGKSGLSIEEAIKSYFVGTQGAYDLDWALNLLELPISREQGGRRVQLPNELMAELFAGYCVRRVPDVLKGEDICRDANRWLSSRIATLRQVQTDIPEPLEELRTKERRERLAVNYTERVLRLLNAMTDFGEKQVPAIRLWHGCSQPLKAWGMLPDLPKFKTTDRRDDFIEYHLKRWIDAKWWARRLRKIGDQYNEHCAILLGKVRKGVSAYVSSQGLQAFVERQQRAAAWLKDMEAYNAQDDIIINLEDAVKASIANPENRRHELVVRARGFSDVADEMGYVGLFFTWTAPSRFHPWKTVKAAQVGKADSTTENPKYQGQSPRDTQRYIAKQWERCRSALARNITWAPGLPLPGKPLCCSVFRVVDPRLDGNPRWHVGGLWDNCRQILANTLRPFDDPIEYFGFRVVEPHHDGTPHWHMLVWVRPAHQHRLISILQRYALADNKEDLVRRRHPDSKQPYSDITPRFDWKVMDKEKGGAVGYIVKYIAKNIDGYRVGEQGDLEAETAATEGARRVRAWASLWGLRQFQPLKGPPVGVWRELRRLPGRLQAEKGIVVAPLASPVMEECRRYADAADWKNFTQAMGGPCCRRDARPLSLYHTAKDEPNQYGEPVTKLLGVRACDGITLSTRVGDWVLRKCGAKGTSKAQGGRCVAVGERSELKGFERSEGLSPLGALAITVREDLATSKKDPESERIEKALIHLGLDGNEIAMVQRGAIVKSGDRYVCIRDGQLKVTDKHPFADPAAIVPHQVEIAAQQREAQRRIRLDEARALLVQSDNPAAWLAGMTAAGTDDTLALLDALDEGDEAQIRASFDHLREQVDLARWPQPPVEPRQENISNAEFFGPWTGKDGAKDAPDRVVSYQSTPQEQARADRMRADNTRHQAAIAEACEHLGVN